MDRINKKAVTLIEMLLALAILSVSMYPIVYIENIASPVKIQNNDEYMATMLAHHVMETIIARRAKNPTYMPSMSESKLVVQNSDNVDSVCEYFKNLPEYSGPVTELKDSQLFWSINKFKCAVDTYFLDENLFKVIVYVVYEKDGREMKTYLERLFTQNNNMLDDEEDE